LLNGNHLPCPKDVLDRYKWLDEEANYSILAHDSSADPIFIYANRFALSCFKYTLDEILFLPSRLSASAPNRSEREQLVKTELPIITRMTVLINQKIASPFMMESFGI
jgi:hypothetical protein